MATKRFLFGPMAMVFVLGATLSAFGVGATRSQAAPTFSFTEGAEGWEFRHAATLRPPLHEAIPGRPGMLRLRADNDNTSTFGYWESPVFQIQGVEHPDLAGAVRIPVDNTGDTLFVAQFQVAGTDDPARAPQMRLRATSVSLSKSAMLVVASQGDGAYSPRAEPRSYPLLFVPSPDSIGFRTMFEMLNFDPADNPRGRLDLQSLVLYQIPSVGIGSLRVEKTYAFDQDAEGWIFYAPSSFDAPGTRQEDGALVLQSRAGDNVFGYWTSPLDSSAVVVEPDRFYIARFTVASDVPPLFATKVPGFRCRLHEESFRVGSVVAIESLTGSVSPVEGQPREIDVYLLPPPTAAGQRLVLAFDMAKFAFGDSDLATLRLEEVTILSGQFQPPK